MSMEQSPKFKVGDKVYVDNPKATNKEWLRIYDNKNGPFTLRGYNGCWSTNVSDTIGGNFVIREEHLVHEDVFNSPLFQALL